jgi:hypothetical protein
MKEYKKLGEIQFDNKYMLLTLYTWHIVTDNTHQTSMLSPLTFKLLSHLTQNLVS